MNELSRARDSSDANVQERERMVRRIRATTDIHDRRILSAFLHVPRHLFVTEAQRGSAHEDRALPLSEMQTISQPSMIAIMLQALDLAPQDRVLEVGAGSGYAAALVARLVTSVEAIEIRPLLAAKGRQTLAALGVDNVRVHVGDGSVGLPERAPYDKILVSAGAVRIPTALVDQLAPGGRIAIPVGSADAQTLLVGERRANGEVTWEKSIPCMFVPLVEQTPPS
jgi:protein-L-isoaspartate(D-aspartate) O-methyltransferase